MREKLFGASAPPSRTFGINHTAARVLTHLGPAASNATPALLLAMQAPAGEIVSVLAGLLREPALQWEAAKILGRLGPEAASAIPELLAAMVHTPTHRPSRTPHFAAWALGRLAPWATAELVRLLQAPDSDVRVFAAIALAGHGNAVAPAVPGLIRMLDAEDPEEQMTAAQTLGALGSVAAGAIPELTRLSGLETTQDVLVGHVRSAARAALTNILAHFPDVVRSTAQNIPPSHEDGTATGQ